jgi:hypothetical protein
MSCSLIALPTDIPATITIHRYAMLTLYVVVGDQGPEPLGLLYTLFSRSSHCRRQMSPRPTRRERSEQREVEL